MKKYLFLLALVVVGVISGHFVTTTAPAVHAQGTTYPLTGWLWSNNVGLFCLSSAMSDCGTGSPFQVQIESNGDITGYAFSSNVGWLKFGPFDPDAFPVTGGIFGTSEHAAHVELDTNSPNAGKITGWALACSAASEAGCNNSNNASGGWDGWVSLSGNTVPADENAIGVKYGVDLDMFDGSFNTKPWILNGTPNDATDKAWGGDVIGWLDFSNASCPTCVNIPPPTALEGTCTITGPSSPYTLLSGQSSITLVNNVAITNSIGPFTYTYQPASLTLGVGEDQVLSVLVTDTGSNPKGRVTLSCGSFTVKQPVGESAHLYIGVTAANASVKPLSLVRGNKPFALKWENPDEYDCTGTAPSQWSQWNKNTYDLATSSNTGTDLRVTPTTPTGTYTFTLSCKDNSNNPLPAQSVTLKITSSIEIEI